MPSHNAAHIPAAALNQTAESLAAEGSPEEAALAVLPAVDQNSLVAHHHKKDGGTCCRIYAQRWAETA